MRAIKSFVRSILFLQLTAVATIASGCGDSSPSAPAVGIGGTGATEEPSAQCVQACEDFADCNYNLCLLNGGTTCGTERITNLQHCDDLTTAECTDTLISAYETSCSSEDAGSGGAEATGGTGESTGGAGGSDMGSGGSAAGTGEVGGVGGTRGGTGGSGGAGDNGASTTVGTTTGVGGGPEPCCENQECGIDPNCGMSCGTCNAPYECSSEKQCEPGCATARFTWNNTCATQSGYDAYCGGYISLYSAIALCEGSSCVWAASGSSVWYDIPFNETVNLTAYNCIYPSVNCGNPYFNQTCPLPGVGTVACACNSAPFSLINNDCVPATENAC